MWNSFWISSVVISLHLWLRASWSSLTVKDEWAKSLFEDCKRSSSWTCYESICRNFLVSNVLVTYSFYDEGCSNLFLRISMPLVTWFICSLWSSMTNDYPLLIDSFNALKGEWVKMVSASKSMWLGSSDSSTLHRIGVSISDSAFSYLYKVKTDAS